MEFYANNSTDVGDYLIGEKIDINGDGTPLRYMDKPSKDGASADYWYAGVGNLDVALLLRRRQPLLLPAVRGQRREGRSTASSYNSPTSDGSTVTGIGRDKAEQDLVPGADHVHDLHDQLRGAPARPR